MEYLVPPFFFGACQDLTSIFIKDEVDAGTRYEYVIGTHVNINVVPFPEAPSVAPSLIPSSTPPRTVPSPSRHPLRRLETHRHR